LLARALGKAYLPPSLSSKEERRSLGVG